MFLRELTGEQQRAFLVLARQVISANERLAMQELERLEGMYREMGVPAETADAPDEALDLNYLFDASRSRAVVFIELLMVAYADGVFDADENRTLTSIADAMNVPPEVRGDAINWVRRMMDLWREGEQIGTS